MPSRAWSSRGGKTRRAAKMVILDADHPDVMDFIESKASEERKAWALIEAGYDPSFTGEAYGSVFFQNANHSVRVTDDFMHAVEQDGDWTTREVTIGRGGRHAARTDASSGDMAEAAWLCGDPGIQYDTTINDWHTSAVSDRIYASNPCSEYMFLNDTACNLASMNLMKFVGEDGEFDVEAYRFASRVTITAQEILVDNASYPTPQIEENSHRFRPLGIGYANLGALLMSRGLAYDSDAGRAVRGHPDRDHDRRGISPVGGHRARPRRRLQRLRHQRAALPAGHRQAPRRGLRHPGRRRAPAAHRCRAADLGRGARAGPPVRLPQRAGVRARAHGHHRVHDGLRYHRHRARHRARQVQEAGRRGLPQDRQQHGPGRPAQAGLQRRARPRRSSATSTSGRPSRERPALKPEHLAVFDCAFKPVNGERSIHYMGHVRMMGATQPFLSGAISKTVNMPEAATAEDIEDVYLQGWKLGLKAIAIYRDGSKRSQPLSTGKKKDADSQTAGAAASSDLGLTGEPKAYRRRLPAERAAVTHKFQVAGHEGYITVGLYEDGQPGELFLKMAKEGSTISGLMDTIATMTSVSLQYGVPLRDLVNKFAHVRFEPAGFTGNNEIPIAKSIVDYVFRWMGSRFLPSEEREALGLIGARAGGLAWRASVRPADVKPVRQCHRERRRSRRALPASAHAATGRRAPAHQRTDRAGGLPLAPAAALPTAAMSLPEWEWEEQRARHGRGHGIPGRGHQGLVQRQRGLTELRRLRQHHGPQRQLLQVPQLRLHERLQLGAVGCRPYTYSHPVGNRATSHGLG